MKMWRSVVTLMGVVFFLVTSVAVSPAKAVDVTTVMEATPRVLAAETTRRNEADEVLRKVGQKIDLNNSDVRDFRQLRGFYPKLASIIIQNAPYEKVEDVLNIPGLTEAQKQRLQANLDNFVVNPPSPVFNEGDERYNPGVY